MSSQLSVNYPPIATASYEQNTACTGSTLLLHGTGAGSYAWSGPNGFTSNQQNPQIPNVTVANSGLYILVVTSPNGCTATTTLNITINNPPALSANPTLTQTCEGSKIQLFASGTGSFVWNGPATYTSTDQNPVIQNIPIHMSGIYTVNLTASTGCVSTASVTVKVYDQIHAIATASEDTICQGQSLQLHAEGGSTYLWNGPNGFNSTESDPRIDNITPAASGKYFVYISNEGGCFGYAELTIMVKPSAKSFAYATPSPVNENSPVQFIASSNGVAYSWSGPLGFTSNQQNPFIKKVTRYMAGVYTVTITNENGCPSIVKVILRVLYTNKGGNTIDGDDDGLTTRSEATGTVYPNPTNDLLYFDTQSSEAIEYVIYDVNGKMQVVQKTTSDRYISTSQLSSGIYQIRWKSKDSDKWIVSKFVKIR
ncbi:MAG: T9SS type A sorting domain-containing protein [Saprospiraceae bacterium]|nr:T9SS type A sorting domain-containing protein [Candidatus Brachybacter algidus]MBK8748266.1 T9SS type A sorting domain-containing protein [Candidatus Brachybacter algidus]